MEDGAKAPAGPGQDYWVFFAPGLVEGEGHFNVFLLPVGTPQRDLGNYLIGKAQRLEQAKAIAERHFNKSPAK